MPEAAHNENNILCGVVCPITLPYEIDANCDNTKAGVEPKMYLASYCSLVSIHTDELDSKVISIPLSIDAFIEATFKESETSAAITGTLNDNDNPVEMDEIEGKGTVVTVEAFQFFRQFKNKHVVLVMERSDGTFMVFGWDGGLKLREWKYDTGKKQNDDFHGFTFKFENKTRKTGLILEPDASVYPNGMEDQIATMLTGGA